MKKKPPHHRPAKHDKAVGGGFKHGGGSKHHPKHKPKKKPDAAVGGGQWKMGSPKHHGSAKHHQHGKHKPAKWSPGLDVASCSVEALAASLRRTGATVGDADVLDLYWRITGDPDAGATVWEAVTAAAGYGLAGVRPVDARPAAALEDGTVLTVELAEPHAVVLDGPGVWSWGAWWPLTRPLVITEAWEVRWA